MFALATGLRQGNILGLTWDRVDMTRRMATIEHGDTKNGDALGVPLNDLALGVLERQRASMTPMCSPIGARRSARRTHGPGAPL